MRVVTNSKFALKTRGLPLLVAALLILPMATANAIPIDAGIHGYKYDDLDGDGVFDGNEGPLAATSFELLDNNGDVIDTILSDVNGQFWFVGLLPGTYGVRENPIPAGFDLTTLPNERYFTVDTGQHLVYEPGAAMLPANSQGFETILGDELRWGNAGTIPEPATLVLLGLGFAGLGFARRRRS